VDEEAEAFANEVTAIDNERAMSLWEKKKKTSWSALCCAVKQMTFLERLTWTQEDEIHEDVVSSFVSVLGSSCPHLRRVTTRYTDRSRTAGPISLGGLTLNHFGVSRSTGYI
jgi:hypothetical protein